VAWEEKNKAYLEVNIWQKEEKHLIDIGQKQFTDVQGQAGGNSKI